MARTTKPPTRRRTSGKSRYIPRRKVCPFCVNKVRVIDYKDISLLRRYISDRGRMEPRRKTGVCARHQRVLSVALKRARHIALLPYTAEHIRQSGATGFRESGPRSSGPRGMGRRQPMHDDTGPRDFGARAAIKKEPKAEEASPEVASTEVASTGEPVANKTVAEEPVAEEPISEDTGTEEASPDKKSD